MSNLRKRLAQLISLLSASTIAASCTVAGMRPSVSEVEADPISSTSVSGSSLGATKGPY